MTHQAADRRGWQAHPKEWQNHPLWADGYDKTVGVSDEENTYPFAGYKNVLGAILCSAIWLLWVRNIAMGIVWLAIGIRKLRPD